MTRDDTIRKILVLGSGAIKIGEAGESCFDRPLI